MPGWSDKDERHWGCGHALQLTSAHAELAGTCGPPGGMDKAELLQAIRNR